MDIALTYTVHSNQLEEAPVIATVNGVQVPATVPRVVIELVAASGDHGHIFRLPVTGPADAAAWSRAFAVGEPVTITLTVRDPL
jgi:hypothetical protein